MQMIRLGRRQIKIAFVIELAILALIFYLQVTAGITSVGEGLGGDGVRYAKFLTRLPELFSGHKWHALIFERLFPVALARLAIEVRGTGLSTSSIIAAFDWVAIFAMAVAYVFFHFICQSLRFTDQMRWVSFAFCFLSFPVARYAGYNPVLTDIVGFTLGLGALLFYLRGELWPLAAVVFLAGFSWPPGYWLGLVLLVFPRELKVSASANLVRHLTTIGFFLVVASFTAALLFLQAQEELMTTINDITPIQAQWLWPSLTVTMAFQFWVVQEGLAALKSEQSEANWTKKKIWLSLGLAVVVYVLRSQLMRSFTLPGSVGSGGRPLIETLLLFFKLSLVAPGFFLVAHYYYWGLGMVLLLVFHLRRTLRRAAQCGFGLYLVFVATTVLMLDSESRHTIFVVPSMLILMTAVVDHELKLLDVLLVLLAQIVVSKIYLVETVTGTLLGFGPRAWDRILDRMSLGPWMSLSFYLLGLGLMILSAVAIALYRYTICSPTTHERVAES